MVKNILIVCVGNICRSPIGERILAHYHPELSISSAGIHALVGQDMDPLSRKLLQEGGYNSNLHIARQIDADLCRQADLILAMEKSHIEAIRSFSIEASGKTMLITKWTDNSDIPDPYKKSEELFRLVHQKILDGITAWNKYL